MKIKIKEMKKITFLFLASFLLFSCEKPEDLSIDSPTPPTEITVPVDFTLTVTNVTVYDGTDGKISIVPSSGVAPLQYKIGDGTYQTSDHFDNLKAGTYTITAKDSKNTTASKTATITQPAAPVTPPLVFTLSATNATAYGTATGSITVSVTSGVPPYNYSLQGGETNSTGVFSNLKAGTYNVTVTDSKQQSGSASIQITEPALVHPTPVYSNALINCSSYDKNALSTEVSNYANVMQGLKKFSISFWYNTTGTQLNKNNPSYTTAFLFYTDHNSNPTGEANIQLEINKARIECIKYKSSEEKVTLSSTTAWQGLHHIVIIYDGANLKMYFDNTLVNSTPSSISLLFNKFYIGGSYNSTYDYTGTISKFKIYDSDISTDEIDYLYKN